MNTIRRMGGVLLLIAAGVFAQSVFAQGGDGQLWVRSFDDRDGSGQREVGEPLLSAGVVVELLNADGIVIATAALDNAPYAAQGLIGFQGLAPGRYTVRISAGDWIATTPEQVTADVVAGGVPPVIEFGARAPAAQTDDGRVNMAFLASETARITLAGVGALFVAGVMFALGWLIYAVTLRPRGRALMRNQSARATGEHPIE